MEDAELVRSEGSGVAAATYSFSNLLCCKSGIPGRSVSSQLLSGELSGEIVGDLLSGGYLRAVKCDCLVLSLWCQFTSIALIVLHSFVGSVL